MTDAYVVVDIATTCDGTGYVGKDSMEIIEISWAVILASSLKLINIDSILIRPVNTPITPYCTQKYDINWELVRNAGTFKQAIEKFTSILQMYESFSFVTYDINKLRVQLIREARDKLVELPEYLKYPRVFDLEKEVGKWKKDSILGLSSMLSALNIQDYDLQKHDFQSNHQNQPDSGDLDQNNDHKQNFDQSQINSDTKARRYVNIYSKILIELIKKSIPITEYPDVLTQPYDSKQDINAFKLEKSKILYLANLPQDTTQSELESWFTQYGGRPIAFWCVKGDTIADSSSSYSSNGYSGGSSNSNITSNSNSRDSPNLDSLEYDPRNVSGFAVFATHEEAIESLSMNGRVLNDKSVEVQPSSIKILDNASDLLTPFPPSKNRPRPGDWTCPSCGFSNFQRRTHCFRCSFPASSAVAIQESMYSGRRTGNNNNNSNNNNNINPNNNNNTNNSGGNSNNNNSNNANANSNNNTISNNNNKSSGNSINTNFSNNSTDKLSYNINTPSSNSQYFDQSPSYSQPNTPSHYQSNPIMNSNGGNQQHNNNNNNNNNNSMNSNNNNNSNNNGNNSNNNARGNHYGNNVPFRAGDWKCEICMYHNFAKNLCCLKCSASKPLVNMTNQPNSIHSVNSTAAAIAAATASGQPLNLNNGYNMGMQQSQSHHVYNQPGQRKTSNNVGKYQYSNSSQSQNSQPNQQQSNQYSKNINHSGNLNGNGQQHLQQHYSMLVSQPQNQIKFSQSGQNSPGLYPHFSNQGGQYSKQSTPNLSGIANDSTASIDSNLQLNSSFNVLTGQIGSLNLNLQ